MGELAKAGSVALTASGRGPFPEARLGASRSLRWEVTHLCPHLLFGGPWAGRINNVHLAVPSLSRSRLEKEMWKGVARVKISPKLTSARECGK